MRWHGVGPTLLIVLKLHRAEIRCRRPVHLPSLKDRFWTINFLYLNSAS